VEKKDAVYVGDTEVDLQTARNAGLDCAAVGWGFRTEEELRAAGASRVFFSAEELLDWLLGD
jgi:phosphoglycolate phosphatase